MFEGILGNESVKGHLGKALAKGDLPQTLLFSGLEGVGKSLFALDLAKTLLKLGKKSLANHPDFHEYIPDGKTHTIDSMRKLSDEVYQAPFEAKGKVFLIHDAEKMLPAAANALLKTLEEPLLDTTLILLTASADELLATILSRCTLIRFLPLKEEEISRFLMEKEKIDEASARELARLAEGSLGRALFLAKDPDFKEKRETLLDLLMRRNIRSYADAWKKMQRLEELYGEEGREALLFHQILLWERDIRLPPTSPRYHPEALSYVPPKSLPPFTKVEGVLEEAKQGFSRNMKLSFCLEYFFLKLSS